MTDTMAYTGSYRCGCIVAVAILNPDHPEDTVHEAYQWLEKDRLALELRPLAEIKADPAFMRECGAGEHEAVSE